MNRHVLALSLALVSAAPDRVMANDAGKNIRVNISDIRNNSGDIGCLLFDSADGFPEDTSRAYRVLHVGIDADRAVCEFKNVAPGTYAVIVLHDENGNKKLDKNLLGIPQEGYMASNNERPLLSPPRFGKASFTLNGNDLTTLKIGMRY